MILAQSMLLTIFKKLSETINFRGISLPEEALPFFTIQLDVTNACNLRCSHCYHPDHDNTGALSLENWKEIVLQHVELCKKLNRVPRFVLCGGEPLLYRQLFPLLEFLTPLQSTLYPILLLTNGTLVTGALAQKLKDFNVAFQISLDGPDAQRHDVVRGPGTFEKSVKGIAILLEQDFEVSLLAVLSKRSHRWIDEFFSMASTLGVSRMSFARFISEGVGKLDGEQTLQPAELKDAYSRILTASKKFEMASGTSKPLFHLISEELGNSGRWGYDAYVIDYKGNLKVSSRIPVIAGNVLAEGLENLFLKSPVFKALRSGSIKKCGSCKYYFRCGGDRNAAYAASGDVLAPDPGCWL